MLNHSKNWIISCYFGNMTPPKRLPQKDFELFSLPINLFMFILIVIVPAKAMRASVSSNWRVFHFRGVS